MKNLDVSKYMQMIDRMDWGDVRNYKISALKRREDMIVPDITEAEVDEIVDAIITDNELDESVTDRGDVLSELNLCMCQVTKIL